MQTVAQDEQRRVQQLQQPTPIMRRAVSPGELGAEAKARERRVAEIIARCSHAAG